MAARDGDGGDGGGSGGDVLRAQRNALTKRAVRDNDFTTRCGRHATAALVGRHKRCSIRGCAAPLDGTALFVRCERSSWRFKYCSRCGVRQHRDVCAAINLLRLFCAGAVFGFRLYPYAKVDIHASDTCDGKPKRFYGEETRKSAQLWQAAVAKREKAAAKAAKAAEAAAAAAEAEAAAAAAEAEAAAAASSSPSLAQIEADIMAAAAAKPVAFEVEEEEHVAGEQQVDADKADAAPPPTPRPRRSAKRRATTTAPATASAATATNDRGDKDGEVPVKFAPNPKIAPPSLRDELARRVGAFRGAVLAELAADGALTRHHDDDDAGEYEAFVIGSTTLALWHGDAQWAVNSRRSGDIDFHVQCPNAPDAAALRRAVFALRERVGHAAARAFGVQTFIPDNDEQRGAFFGVYQYHIVVDSCQVLDMDIVCDQLRAYTGCGEKPSEIAPALNMKMYIEKEEDDAVPTAAETAKQAIDDTGFRFVRKLFRSPTKSLGNAEDDERAVFDDVDGRRICLITENINGPSMRDKENRARGRKKGGRKARKAAAADPKKKAATSAPAATTKKKAKSNSVKVGELRVKWTMRGYEVTTLPAAPARTRRGTKRSTSSGSNTTSRRRRTTTTATTAVRRNSAASSTADDDWAAEALVAIKRGRRLQLHHSAAAEDDDDVDVDVDMLPHEPSTTSPLPPPRPPVGGGGGGGGGGDGVGDGGHGRDYWDFADASSSAAPRRPTASRAAPWWRLFFA